MHDLVIKASRKMYVIYRLRSVFMRSAAHMLRTGVVYAYGNVDGFIIIVHDEDFCFTVTTVV